MVHFKKGISILLALSVICGLFVFAVPVAADTYNCTVENTPYYFNYYGQQYQKGRTVFSASGTIYPGGYGLDSAFYVGSSNLYDRYFVVFAQAKGSSSDSSVTLGIDHSYIGHPRESVNISSGSWGSTCTVLFLSNTCSYLDQTNYYRISLNSSSQLSGNVEYKVVVYSYYI